MHQKPIEQLIAETINSFDGAKRAEVKPFLLTRILARMQADAEADNIWTRAGAFLSRPAVALAGILLIVLVNVAIIVSNSNETNSTVQQLSSSKDEFAINVISIYDTENLEP